MPRHSGILRRKTRDRRSHHLALWQQQGIPLEILARKGGRSATHIQRRDRELTNPILSHAPIIDAQTTPVGWKEFDRYSVSHPKEKLAVAAFMLFRVVASADHYSSESLQ